MVRADVIVIGAGLAGMVAAYSAREQGAGVVLIDRGAVGTGTNSAMSNGRFAGPTASYTREQFIRDTIHTGRDINNEPQVHLLAQEAPSAFQFLRSIGLELDVFSDHYFYKSSRSDVMRGTSMTKSLSQKILALERIRVVTGFYITDILKSENGVSGVGGFDRYGEELTFSAPAVVLATGGGGAVYLRNDNQKSIMGQGYYLAARAGLELYDMEFVQFYPIVMAESRMPSMMIYPPYPQALQLINADGEDIIEKYGDNNLNAAMRKKRDRFSEIILRESAAGPVKLDFQGVSADLWNEYPLTLLARINFDFRKQPVTVLPGAHFLMGGVRINHEGRTDIPGLFACGEVVWGLHGANRMSGNALTECVVFGRIAGLNAAIHALDGQLADAIPPAKLKAAEPPAGHAESGFSELRQRLREIAWRYAGIVRDTSGMRTGLAELEETGNQIKRKTPQDITQKKQKADLESAAFTLKAILTASTGREETRGAFIRKEYPQTDDDNWRRNSCLRYVPGTDSFSLKHLPVDKSEALSFV